jgi:polysaccharide biosynthesis/export protein
MLHHFSMLKCGLRPLLVVVATVASMAAQTTNTVAGHGVSASKATSLETIAAGDVLQISVFGVPELSQQLRVANDGKAQLSLLGELGLAGLTEADAAALIAGQLRERNFLLHPRVNVAIKESASQFVSVIGAVEHPGVYPITSARTLLDVLSLAGGLTNTADSKINIKRHSAAEDTITVTYKGSDAGALSSIDALVYPGDSVIVPRAGIVYVLGDVVRPGGFVMQDSGRITLLQAMAEAGGPLATAAANHMMLLHEENGNYVVAKKLDFGKTARGVDADLELHANDILFVPNARLKSALRTSGRIAATAASISTVAIYGASVH